MRLVVVGWSDAVVSCRHLTHTQRALAFAAILNSVRFNTWHKVFARLSGRVLWSDGGFHAAATTGTGGGVAWPNCFVR